MTDNCLVPLFREGRFAELRLGVSVREVRAFLGAPESETRGKKGRWLGKFGPVEVACDASGRVEMILLACWRARRGESWPKVLGPDQAALNALANYSLRSLLRFFQSAGIEYQRVPILCVLGDQLVIRSSPHLTAAFASYDARVDKVVIG